MARVDNDLLAMALVGYEAQRVRIDGAIRDIQSQLGHRGPGRPAVVPDGAGQSAQKKRTMSAAARKRIAAAQRKRWAALKKSQAQGKSAATARAPKKWKLSAAGRRAIIAATKKRWAAVRKAAAKSPSQ
jgi:hypothetical protein